MPKLLIRPIYLALPALLWWCSNLNAQQLTNFTQVVAPLDSPAVEFREYLVQLAWINSPDNAITQALLLNEQDEAYNIRREWMRDVQATFNLNEGNLNGSGATTVRDSAGNIITETTSGNVFFPRYNFGLTLNLFNLLSQKKKNSIGKRDIQIAEHKINQKKLEIRAETLTRYQRYLLALEIVETRRQIEQDARSRFVLVEQQYLTNEKGFDDFSAASSTWYEAKESRMKAESDLQIALYQLEEIIGLPWVIVTHPAKK